MVEFVEIKDVNHSDFKEAMRIYSESFPPNERHPVDTIKQRLKDERSQLYVGKLGHKAVFMSLLYPLKNTNFILFDYMATDRHYQNQGVGAEFVKTLIKSLGKNKPNKYLILEVENPNYGDNKEQRRRRLNFYKKLGAKEMKGVRYILPALSGEDSPTEMIILILPNYNNGKIDGGSVKKLIYQIYKELYNRDKNDGLLNLFINDIKDTVELT
ncbi:MAG: GNAT family N-acetyltransferase [Candidatus Micrarchaeota archaeon]|nr:GNAT family N-acetyltransferase [Candidatus Micrarchaeota archaeon]